MPPAEIWPRVDEALRRGRLPLRPRRRRPARCPAASSSGWRWPGSLALRPGLLLLDEVTANLDPAGAALVRAVLAEVLGATGATVVHGRAPGRAGRRPGRPRGRARAGRRRGRRRPARRACSAAHGAGLAARGRVGARAAHPPYAARHRRRRDRPWSAAEAVRFRYPGAGPGRAGADRPRRCAPASALALTGPNGVGQVDAGAALAGLLRPTGGAVRAEPALDPPQPPRPLWRWRGRDLVSRIGTVFQDPEHQFVTATVRDELAVGPRRAGATDAAAGARADELLERLGLARLAGGQPVHAVRRREAAAVGGDRDRDRAAGAWSPTSRRSARTPGPGPSWSSCSPTCATAAAALVLVTHDDALVDALADRTVTMRRTPR